MSDLQAQAVALLSHLIRCDTSNPPGNEREAIEHLERLLAVAGFSTEVLAADPGRPNLVATLAGPADGPVLAFLGHVDTVPADAGQWRHGPWSGDVADGHVWGRGAIDMKSQVAAATVAAAELARSGWHPSKGTLKLVLVSDEETGGDLGARWLCAEHPEAVRCDLLINEGGGQAFTFRGRRHYGVCCGEKGIYPFALALRGTAGHASIPRAGDNALLKLAPVLTALADVPAEHRTTPATAALLRGLGLDPGRPEASLAVVAAEDPRLHALLEPLFTITLNPTMASASGSINVTPSQARLGIDCRVPPGLGEAAARQRIADVLGAVADLEDVVFTEAVTGNESAVESPLMDAIARWVGDQDPEARTVPVVLPGFSDSNWFRAAFPQCVAYGFFPMRHQGLLDATPLMHNADERIDIRDLGLATICYQALIRDLLGSPLSRR